MGWYDAYWSTKMSTRFNKMLRTESLFFMGSTAQPSLALYLPIHGSKDINVSTLFHELCAARQKVQGRAKVRHPRQNKVVLPQDAKHVGRAGVEKNESSRSDSTPTRFDVAAIVSKIGDIALQLLERDRVSCSKRTFVALMALHGIAETKCRGTGKANTAILPKGIIVVSELNEQRNDVTDTFRTTAYNARVGGPMPAPSWRSSRSADVTRNDIIIEALFFSFNELLSTIAWQPEIRTRRTMLLNGFAA